LDVDRMRQIDPLQQEPETQTEQKDPPPTPVGKQKAGGVTVTILADGTTTDSKIVGRTRIKPSAWAPGYESSGSKITKITGAATLTWTIQTIYGPNGKATLRSGYGRGTTPDDKASGNTSLGFHESCHREDFLNYLKAHPSPTTFRGKVGMTVSDFKKAQSEFIAAVDTYRAAMEKGLRDPDRRGGVHQDGVRSGQSGQHPPIGPAPGHQPRPDPPQDPPQAMSMTQKGLDRREFLWHAGGGLGGIALAHLLGAEGLLAAEGTDAKPKADLDGGLHHRARARRVVQLFMSGAASQVGHVRLQARADRTRRPAVRPRRQGRAVPERPGRGDAEPLGVEALRDVRQVDQRLLPHLATCVDDMAFLHAMVSKSNVHGPATFLQNTGFVLPGFPSMGAWVSYGLGTLNQDLPAFVVLPDSRGFAPNGPANWGAGFLPASHQGTTVRAGAKNPIYDLFPPADAAVTPQADRDGLALLDRLNRQHAATREGDSRLEARIASYELAARLQLSAPEVLDLTGRDGRDARAVRPRRGDHRGLRPQLPDRPPAAGARGPVRAGLERRRQRLPPAQLGLARGHRPRPRRDGGRHGPARRRLAEGPEGPRACSTTRSSSGPPSSAGCRAARGAKGAITTRSPSRRGWPAAASKGASPTAGATSGRTRRPKASPPATTCTPRSCTCWASTTAG
jgi:hypothetical protein